MNRVFIMSSERSGSNLLRQILGRHPEMIAPTAIHFTTNLAKWSAFYHSSKKIADKQLVRDMLELASAHIAPWHYSIDVDQVCQAVAHHNFWGVFIALYDTLARTEGKSGWVCKDNALFDYAAEILNFYPDCKFLYLARDGRDVALSFQKMPTGPKTISDAAMLWTLEQQACMRIALLYPRNVHMVRYEDLLQQSYQQVKSICNHVNLDYSDRLLSSVSDPLDMSKKSVFWENLSKPLMTGNFNKWRRKMKSSDAKYYQSVLNGETKGVLKLLHYDVMDTDLPLHRTRIRRICDFGLAVFHYLKRIVNSPEKVARHPKKVVLGRIRARIINTDV